MGEQKVDIKDTTVTITSDVQFEKHTVSVVLTLDMKQGVYTDMSFNIDYTLAEKMEQAGLNTLMGLGIVFCMLGRSSKLSDQPVQTDFRPGSKNETNSRKLPRHLQPLWYLRQHRNRKKRKSLQEMKNS